jgi:hypothetical protein
MLRADVPGFYNRLGVVLPNNHREWVGVRCFLPGHQDRHASSSVNLENGAWKCFTCNVSGGPYKAALARGYTSADATELVRHHGLWREKPSAAPPRPVQTPDAAKVDWNELAVPEPQPTQVRRREWDYLDENSQPLFRAVRVDLDNGRKRFWQERWEGGRWLAGLKNTRRVLYRLPQVRERALTGRLVLIVEGEKACDALDRLQVFATTSPGGAGKWVDVYSVSLAGAICAVIPDCDLPGRRHAIDVTRNLILHRVTVLQPLELAPGRQDGFDITDHLTELARGLGDSGDVREQLRAHLLELVHGLAPATSQTIGDWEERLTYRANPDGLELLLCARCQRERVHKVKAGVRYCPCGGAQ